MCGVLDMSVRKPAPSWTGISVLNALDRRCVSEVRVLAHRRTWILVKWKVEIVVVLHRLAPFLVSDLLVCVDVKSSNDGDHLSFGSPETVESKEVHHVGVSNETITVNVNRVEGPHVGPVRPSLQV